ncbi:A/G-specific adenine glycosylase [Corynebacterium incognita]|uniref:A/G-specific adenine glycosylase n=1 Tax=Corynebacterium incognita TaxID=2754725 RepID=UPI002484333B|nr:A/G-specific adenine glycosylase [Corynebacterium incognita]
MNSPLSTADIRAILSWFDANERDLPWRRPGTSAWGVLLSEVMSQQTPVARVAPQWEEWMRRWPTPADFAAADKASVLRAWDRLGYPRRALRLHAAAQAIRDEHGGVVPDDVDELLALPGIGDYTARAVACFAFGRNVPVVDTNVRRVHARAVTGVFLQPAASRKELAQVAPLLDAAGARGPRLSAALMELGALVCTAKNPDCGVCPLKASCAWQRAGCPQPSADEAAQAKRRGQKIEGTDRQVRGKIMAVLRAAEAPVAQADIDAIWPDAAQRSRALYSLLEDGLAEQDDDGRFSLPR